MKSAPVDDVSELPLVPTNDAPTCASHNGGGGAGAAGVCAAAAVATSNRENSGNTRRTIKFMPCAGATVMPERSSMCNLPALIGAQCFRRIRARAAQRRGETRKNGSRHQHGWRGEERHRVERRDAEQQAMHQTCDRGCGGESQTKPGCCHQETVSHDKCHKLRAAGAECRAHTEFAPTARYAVREHAEQADG